MRSSKWILIFALATVVGGCSSSDSSDSPGGDKGSITANTRDGVWLSNCFEIKGRRLTPEEQEKKAATFTLLLDGKSAKLRINPREYCKERYSLVKKFEVTLPVQVEVIHKPVEARQTKHKILVRGLPKYILDRYQVDEPVEFTSTWPIEPEQNTPREVSGDLNSFAHIEGTCILDGKPGICGESVDVSDWSSVKIWLDYTGKWAGHYPRRYVPTGEERFCDLRERAPYSTSRVEKGTEYSMAMNSIRDTQRCQRHEFVRVRAGLFRACVVSDKDETIWFADVPLYGIVKYVKTGSGQPRLLNNLASRPPAFKTDGPQAWEMISVRY